MEEEEFVILAEEELDDSGMEKVTASPTIKDKIGIKYDTTFSEDKDIVPESLSKYSLEIYNKISKEFNPAWLILLLKSLDDCYDEDYSMRIYEQDSIYYLETIIHYNEITIKNSLKANHKITDLYVKLELITNPSGNILKYNKFMGLRSNITYAEYRSGYVHSHLPGGTFGNHNFNNFCIGGGGFSRMICNFNDFNHNYNFFTLFFNSMNEYVAWESIEGVPHRRLGNISVNSTHNDEDDCNIDYVIDKMIMDTSFIEDNIDSLQYTQRTVYSSRFNKSITFNYYSFNKDAIEKLLMDKKELFKDYIPYKYSKTLDGSYSYCSIVNYPGGKFPIREFNFRNKKIDSGTIEPFIKEDSEEKYPGETIVAEILIDLNKYINHLWTTKL